MNTLAVNLTSHESAKLRESAVDADHFKNGAKPKSQKNMAKFFRAVFFTLLAAGVFFSGCKKDDEDTKTNKVYSITPPPSWIAGEAAGGIETFTGTADGNFSPNMNVVTEAFNGTLVEYVNANVNGVTIILGAELAGRSAFQINSGLSGEKLVFLSTIGGYNLRQIQYCISPKSGSKTYAVITGTGLASYGVKYDNLFDAAAKSFAWK